MDLFTQTLVAMLYQWVLLASLDIGHGGGTSVPRSYSRRNALKSRRGGNREKLLRWRGRASQPVDRCSVSISSFVFVILFLTKVQL